MENEHVAARVDSDPGAFAELNAGRQPRPVFDLFVPVRRCRVDIQMTETAGQRNEQARCDRKGWALS